MRHYAHEMFNYGQIRFGKIQLNKLCIKGSKKFCKREICTTLFNQSLKLLWVTPIGSNTYEETKELFFYLSLLKSNVLGRKNEYNDILFCFI